MMGSMNHNDPDQRAELYAVVRGRVQGVGYRYFVIEMANLLGLRGYARNESDGSVEVLAQGTRSLLERFVTLLRQGPPASDVDDVETTWRTPTEYMSGFRIRY
jgi:acylphosphatase